MLIYGSATGDICQRELVNSNVAIKVALLATSKASEIFLFGIGSGITTRLYFCVLWFHQVQGNFLFKSSIF